MKTLFLSSQAAIYMIFPQMIRQKHKKLNILFIFNKQLANKQLVLEDYIYKQLLVLGLLP